MAEPAAAAALGLRFPSHNTSEISPEFLKRHHRKHEDGGGSGDDKDPLLYFCWRQQSCGSCLAASKACSWCTGSSTCVPNRSPFPLLAPLTSSSICPLGPPERWELRATPLGCNVSTLTFLTGVVSVLTTLVLVLVGWGAAVFGRKGWRAFGFGSGRRKRGDWGFVFRGRGARQRLDRGAGRRVVVFVEEERRPLLV